MNKGKLLADYLLPARVFLQKLQLQETELSETYSEYSLQNTKNNFMLNAGQDSRISIYQTYFVFDPLFSKPILTKGKLYYVWKTLKSF